MTGNTNNLTVFERKKSKEPKQENPPRSPMSGLKPSIARSFLYCVGELHKYCLVLSMFSLLYIGS
jgi:hypothetical protein